MRGSKREWRRRADNVNLANAYKLMGDQTSCDKTLGKEDWSAVDHVFKASVAGVRDDVDEIVRLIKVWPETEKILTEFDFETWPVFFGVRDNPDFLAAFEARFGRKFNPAPKIRNRSLDALNEVQQVLQGKTGSGPFKEGVKNEEIVEVTLN